MTREIQNSEKRRFTCTSAIFNFFHLQFLTVRLWCQVHELRFFVFFFFHPSSSLLAVGRELHIMGSRAQRDGSTRGMINGYSGSVFQRQLFNSSILNSVQLEENWNEHRGTRFERPPTLIQRYPRLVLNPHTRDSRSVNENLSAERAGYWITFIRTKGYSRWKRGRNSCFFVLYNVQWLARVFQHSP